MDQVAAAPPDARRRTSLVVTTAVAIALVVVFIVFAADTQWYSVFKMFHVGAAVVWVGGGIFITICALLAELSNDDDQLLAMGTGPRSSPGGCSRSCRSWCSASGSG
jgi:putative copper export protein